MSTGSPVQLSSGYAASMALTCPGMSISGIISTPRRRAYLTTRRISSCVVLSALRAQLRKTRDSIRQPWSSLRCQCSVFIFASDIPSIIRLTSAAGKKCRAQSSEKPRCGYSRRVVYFAHGQTAAVDKRVQRCQRPYDAALARRADGDRISPIQSVYASSAMAAFSRMSDGPPPRKAPCVQKTPRCSMAQKSFLSTVIAPDRRQTPLPARIWPGRG